MRTTICLYQGYSVGTGTTGLLKLYYYWLPMTLHSSLLAYYWWELLKLYCTDQQQLVSTETCTIRFGLVYIYCIFEWLRGMDRAQCPYWALTPFFDHLSSGGLYEILLNLTVWFYREWPYPVPGVALPCTGSGPILPRSYRPISLLPRVLLDLYSCSWVRPYNSLFHYAVLIWLMYMFSYLGGTQYIPLTSWFLWTRRSVLLN